MSMSAIFHMVNEKGASLQNQLRRAILNAILNGSLAPGIKLPSSRKLSKDMKISRNTVLIVYQHLTDDGYIITKERSGHYVNENFVEVIKQSRFHPDMVTENSNKDDANLDWDKRFQLTPSKMTFLNLPKNWRDMPYPFVYGQPDKTLFPLTAWRECSRLALSTRDMAEWIHDDKIYDDPQLVYQIKTRLLPARGIHVKDENILVTLGGQNALYMAAGLLVRDKTKIAIENPGYPDAQNIMRLFTNNISSIPVDEDGMIVDERLDDCDYSFVTPSHQCPTTVTMSLERRQSLLKRAAEKDFIIIEDDYENEINYFKSVSPALKALDHNNRVVYISSLSKTLFPGLRIGYLVADAKLISELKDYRRLVVRYTPSNNQRTLALFLSLGYYDSLIYSLKKRWYRRWQSVKSALKLHLPSCIFSDSAGGTSFWVTIPPQISAQALVEKAKEKGILIESGLPFFQDNPSPDRHFRIGFTSIKTNKIEPGIAALGECLRDMENKL